MYEIEIKDIPISNHEKDDFICRLGPSGQFCLWYFSLINLFWTQVGGF